MNEAVLRAGDCASGLTEACRPIFGTLAVLVKDVIAALAVVVLAQPKRRDIRELCVTVKRLAADILARCRFERVELDCPVMLPHIPIGCGDNTGGLVVERDAFNVRPVLAGVLGLIFDPGFDFGAIVGQPFGGLCGALRGFGRLPSLSVVSVVGAGRERQQGDAQCRCGAECSVADGAPLSDRPPAYARRPVLSAPVTRCGVRAEACKP